MYCPAVIPALDKNSLFSRSLSITSSKSSDRDILNPPPAIMSSLASLNFLWLGPKMTGIPYTAASGTLCIPAPNPPPT